MAALKLYRAETDDKLSDPAERPVLKPRPVRDWTSHAASSFRYLAMTLDGTAIRTGFHRPAYRIFGYGRRDALRITMRRLIPTTRPRRRSSHSQIQRRPK
jgi:hypothetical protein